MSNTQKEKGTVTLYGVGGTGVNIAKLFESVRGKESLGNANLTPVYVDTSRSNLSDNVKDEYCYLVDGTDGSGKRRRENADEISQRAKDILQKHKPGNLSIVVGSGAGGSGSVIGPNLARELLENDSPVVVILVGDATTRLDALNTLNTLKSYSAISNLTEKPLAVLYVQNSKDNPRKAVDEHVRAVISSLIVLSSRENDELDTMDVTNFLRFDRDITTYGPQLAALTMVDATTDLSMLGNFIVVATLATREEDTTPPGTPDAQYVGYLPIDSDPVKRASGPLHFVLSDGIFGYVQDKLNQFLKDLDKQRSSHIATKALVSDADKVDAKGMVF